MKKLNNSDDILPPNILLKLSWASNVKLLSNKDRSDILLNIYNYHTGAALTPMSKAAQMFFSNAVDVFDYNIIKYQGKVKANRENGAMGGRPKIIEKGSGLVLQKKPNNPDGLSHNPENPKEKDIEKTRDIEKAISRLKDNLNVSEENKDKEFQEKYLGKFVKLLDISHEAASNSEEKNYIFYANLFHKKMGKENFAKLIFEPDNDVVPSLVESFKLKNSLSEIKNIRFHMIYYLDKLIN